MLELVKRMLANDKIRYLIGGGLTTAVNIVTFFLLRVLSSFDRNTCNVIAIVMAITFAYFINKFFVFQSKTKGFSRVLAELVSFVGVRIVSMGIEVLGFAILCDTFRLNEVVSKIAVQFVVIVANYIFSKVFVFKKERRTLAESYQDNYCYYIAMGAVFIVYLAVCIAIKAMPFGGHSVTFVDSLHQYLPYIAEYRDKLLHEGSMFFSWNVGMGINFMALASYYLASPFNFLFLLVSKYQIPSMYAVITCMKLMISAGCMVHFLSYKDGEKQRNPVSIAIGVAYAFSNYMIGYSWNIMWMDCIMILPLIALGFRNLMEDGKPGLYTISMFYCLYCNYYIGFMICIFMVMWFFSYRHGGIKKFFIHGVRFAWYSLLSGGMAAFTLLPAYFGIMATSAGDMHMPKLTWYGTIYNMLRQMFFMTKPITNQTFDGNANLYCGMFAVLAFFLYMFVRNISIYDKLTKLLMLAFLMISFNAENLNYIWHGMHNQYGIPNRFSFLFIFILLIMAYDVICNIKNVPKIAVLFGGFATILLLYLCQKYANGGMSNLVIVSSLCMIVLYVILCMFGQIKQMPMKAYYVVFASVLGVEALASAIRGYDEVGYASYSTYYDTTSQMTEAYNEVKNMEQNSEEFYRAELAEAKVLDEASWHNMPSISIFGSTVRGELVTTMGRLGFYTGANEFLYMGATPFTNSLFNVKYVLRRQDDINNHGFDYSRTIDDVEIYQNAYPLSIGFCVDERTKEWDRDKGLPFDMQNTLAFQMTGGVSFFQPMVPDFVVAGENCTTSVFGNSISYTPDVAGAMKLFITFDVYKNGDYYVNCRGNNVNKIAFYVNDEQIAYDRYQTQIFHIGDLQVGDSVRIEYQYKDAAVKTQNASVYVATFDEVAYASLYEDLKKNMLDVTELDDGYVKGTVYVPNGQMLFTSIPYDAGWHVYVDGEETEITVLGEAFVGVEMASGEHEIEFKYVPKGFWLGFGATIASWVFFLIGVSIYNKKKTTKEEQKLGHNDIDRAENL